MSGHDVPLARLSETPLPPLDLTQPPWPGERVTLDGCGLYVRHTPPTAPTAEPALYVHGLGGAATNWTDLAAQLAGHLDGYAPDLPGFGRSDPPSRRDYSLAAHARIVVRLIERQGRGPVHLFGNSMGGAIAVLIAARRPDLVRTLTLISPAMPDLRPRVGSDRFMPLLLLPGISRLVERRLAGMRPEQRLQALIELVFADPATLPANRREEAMAELRRRGELAWAYTALTASLRGLVAAYLVPPARSLWAYAAQIQAPTLVVWGDKDKLVSVALAPRTARLIPAARLCVLPGVGHTAQMEDPVTVARAVLGLIEDTPARGSVARPDRERLSG